MWRSSKQSNIVPPSTPNTEFFLASSAHSQSKWNWHFAPRLRKATPASNRPTVKQFKVHYSVSIADTSVWDDKGTLYSVSPVKLPKKQAKDFVKQIRQTIAAQNERAQVLDAWIEESKNLACMRLLNKNESGAIMAMKKVHKFTNERMRVTVALDLAEDAAVEVEAALEKAKGKTVDIGEENASVLQEVHQVLCELDRAPPDMNDKLLQQIQELIKEKGLWLKFKMQALLIINELLLWCFMFTFGKLTCLDGRI